VRTQGGLKARRIEVGKRSTVVGPLIGDSIELGRKARAEDLYGGTIEIDERAQVRRVYGERIRLGDGVRVEELWYTGDLRVDGEAEFTRPPQKVSQLPDRPL
jgi:hypothetical protein